MILVLTTPRTGSSWFCSYLAKQHSFENLNEYFGDPDLTVDQQIEKLEYLKQNPNTVLKCFPWHIRSLRSLFKRANFVEKELLKLSDKTYILIRSNFNEQCKSYYIAKSSNVWDGTPQSHTTINFNKSVYNTDVEHLYKGYIELADFYKKYNCDIVEYENLPFSDTPRYQRPVSWSQQPEENNFDPRSVF